MAAYAALTSLNNLIHQIQHHPSPPISIDIQQLKSLTEHASFLLEFLETYQSPVSDGDEADPLEMRIADAAYAATDVIESRIVDAIKIPFNYFGSFNYDLSQGLWEARKVVMETVIKDTYTVKPQLQRNISASGGSSRSSIMVGFEDVLLEVLDKLTSEERRRLVIPIVGMGGIGVTAPDEFWYLSQLRHVEFHKGVLSLSESRRRHVVMKNLQTLKGIHCILRFMDTPNIKKIGVTSGIHPSIEDLTKLESFHCWTAKETAYPLSLKKLSLGSISNVDEKLLLEMIGALPLLEKLKLGQGRLKEWKTREDQFPSLKYLELYGCDLQSWITESSHFPRLERLHLYELKFLEEIPCEIGEIATLQSIVLEHCSESAVESAKTITEEQEDIRVRVVLFNTKKNQALRSLASSNFVVETIDL